MAQTLYTQASSNKIKSLLYLSIFIGLIAGLGYFVSWYLGSSWFFIGAIIFSLVMTGWSYWFSDKTALAVSGAKEIQQQDNPYVYRMVENLAITAGLPMPRVYVIEDSAPNAFATGRDPKHAAIAVTTGIVEKLENEELEGVIAHELAHVGNYDTRLMSIVLVLVGIITLVTDWMLSAFIFGGDENRESGSLGLIIMGIGLVLVILSPFFATLIQLAISRRREYAADATGALMTRYPEGLARALEKISGDTEPLEAANKATAHLYIANPFKGKDEDGDGIPDKRSWFAGLFDTHPPIEERAKALRGMKS